MKYPIFFMILAVALLGSGLVTGSALAEEKTHKLAIHVDDASPKTWNLAINNATNVIKHYGVGNVEIELVAYGPGLDIFHKDSKVAGRLKSLHAFGNVKYGVCGNTMKKKKYTKKDLLQDAFVQNAIVTSGVVRLIELQEAGYSYVKP